MSWLLKRAVALLLPIIFSWVSTNLLINHPILKWSFDRWGPMVVSQAADAEVATDPAVPGQNPDTPDGLDISFPGGGVHIVR